MSRASFRKAAASVLLCAVLAAACAGPGSPSVQGPDLSGFDPSALIDVLPPDTIRAIRDPAHETIEAARAWLSDESPVIVLELGDDAVAYPLAILTRHEIVNDEVGDTKVAVTYCPLCNSAVVFERAVRGLILTFVVSGKLYHSDLVMLDQQTKSLWPQLLGGAVRGELRGASLTTVPSALVSLERYAEVHPAGRVLARPVDDSYGFNPYEGYDSRDRPYGDFFPAVEDARLPAMQRVVGVAAGAAARAYPHERLANEGRPAVVHDRLAGEDLVVFFDGTQRSALDTELIEDGRVVGSSGVFDPVARGRRLRFASREGRIIDEQTGSTWTVLGTAIDGPMEGATLNRRAHVDAFWFAWAAFVPFTEIWDG